MKIWMFIASLVVMCGVAFEARPKERTQGMYPNILNYLAARESEFKQITPERRSLLKELADFVLNENRNGRPPRLLFVCTHNSRRSQLSQVWASAGAAYYNLPGVWAYSGGTESTAFDPRAVAALERAGMRIEKTTHDENPIYHVRYSESGAVITAFSKVMTHAPNPAKDFCAVMVCDSADKSCPSISGVAVRVVLPFVDPKKSDDTPAELRAYDERSAQIAREMLYVMSLVRDAG